jgi:hypothetical protein
MEELKFEEVMAKVNEGKFDSLWDVDEYFEYELKIKSLEEGLDIDKHRWYEVSTSVYPIGDRFLGVSGISQCYSESSGPEDCCHASEAFEMVEKKTVTYVKK